MKKELGLNLRIAVLISALLVMICVIGVGVTRGVDVFSLSCNNLASIEISKIVFSRAPSHTEASLLLLDLPLKVEGKPAELNRVHTLYKCAARWKPKSVQTLRNLGRVYALKGNYAEAIAQFTAANDLVSPDLLSVLWLGDVLHNQGQVDQAITIWKQVEDVGWLFIHRGELYVSSGDLGRAGSSYQVATRILPALSEPYYQLGRVYQRQGLERQTLDSYRRSLQLNSFRSKTDFSPNQDEYTKTRVYQRIGETLSSVEKWEEAIQVFERAIQAEPRNVQAYLGLGWAVYEHTGDAEAGRAVFERALAQKPDSWLVRARLCDLYTIEQDYDVALRWIDEAFVLSPDNAEVLWRLGRIYVLQGRYEQARSSCRLAIQADERSAPAHFWLGQSYFEQGAYALAIPGLEAAVQFMPANVYYRLQLAHAYRLAQRPDDAIRAYRHILEASPENLEARHWLAVLQE